MDTVYPAERVDPGLCRKLAKDYPNTLLVFNPIYRRWQMFEKPKGSDWNARRLYDAIVQHHSKLDRERDPYAKVTPEWTGWLGAPRMRDVLPQPPGWWIIRWLDQNDLWKFPGGTRAWLQAIEEEEAQQEKDIRRQESDLAHDISHSGFATHARDILSGDPLGGHRHWSIQVTKEMTDNGGNVGTGDGSVQSKD